MPVYHIVLLKLKPTASPALVSEFTAAAKAMVGKVDGLLKMDVGPPLPITSHRSQGYDMGLNALLDAPETVPKYAAHPAHQKVNQLREEIADVTLAYDMEF